MLEIGPRTDGHVTLEGVRRSFGPRLVLTDITYVAGAGTLTVITGPNGSGKTSLLRVIGGLLTPDVGTVTVCDSPPGRGRTGLVPAGDRGLHWRLTGHQNLAFFARLSPLPDIEARIARSAVAAGAGDLLEGRVGDGSTGQRRRLMVAQALVGRPPVLLLDEPYADLDEEGSGCVDRIVAHWCDRGGAVIAAAPSVALAPVRPEPTLLRLRGSDGIADVA